MYYDLISKAELAQWADSAVFPSVLPTWIENLVREEAGEFLLECDFPTLDDFTRTGYDGSTKSTKATENVPAGDAKWELGKDKTVREKAESEYLRVAKMLGDDAATEAFVFVTPRPFPQTRTRMEERFRERTRQDWVGARRKEKLFRDVVVIDENMLRKWSAKHFSVGLRIKRMFVPEFSASGLQLPDEAIARFVSNMGMAEVDESILACGRDKSRALINNLTESDSEIFICANSEDEAMAFACHAFFDTDDGNLRAERLRKTLVVTSIEALRQLKGVRGKCFIVSAQIMEHRHLIRSGNQVIVCGALDPESASDWEILRDPGAARLTEYLEAKSVPDARVVAEMAGGSLNCLQRLRGIPAGLPAYASVTGSDLDYLILATLLGGWSEETYYDGEEQRSAKDMELIKSLLPVDLSFTNFRRVIRAHVDKDGAEPAKDTLIKRIGSKYWIKAPVDAIDCLLIKMEDEHFQAFASAILEVFSEQEEKKREHGFLVVDKFGYSETLKIGLALNFCVVTARAQRRGKSICGQSATSWAADLFGKLMKRVDFIQFVDNEGELLGYFAEATPEVFIQALEDEVQGNASALSKFISSSEGDDSLFGDNPAAGIMWALMRLAWIPEHFNSVVRVLLRIHQLDTDKTGRISPRADTVFSGLYAVGVSQTTVSIDQQLDALNFLSSSMSDAAFELVEAALPGSRNYVTTHSKPIFSPADEVRRPQDELYILYAGIFKTAIAMANDRPERIAKMIEKLPDVPDILFDEALERWSAASHELDKSSSTQIWIELRNLIVRHTRFHDSDWGMPDSKIEQLEKWMTILEPSEEDQLKFLFSDAWIEMPQPDGRVEDEEPEDEEELILSRKRTSAVRAFIRSRGVLRAGKFSGEVVEKGHFGMSFAKAVADVTELEEALLSLSTEFSLDGLFFRGCSHGAYYRFEAEWVDSIFRNWPAYRDTNRLHDLLGVLPITENLIDRFKENHVDESIQARHWKDVRVDSVAWNPIEDSLLEVLLEYGRHSELLEALSHSLEVLSDKFLITLVRGYYKSIAESRKSKLTGRSLDSFFAVLKICKERALFEPTELASFEFPLAAQFRWTHSKYPFGIHQLASESPDYFIELLAMKYKTTKPYPNLDRENLDAKFLAKMSFHIFDTMRHPGLQQGHDIQLAALSEWVVSILKKSEEYGLTDSASYQIGEVLSQCSDDPEDQAWPRKVVREIIEQYSNDRMLSGIRTKNFNSRGVYSNGFQFFSRSAEKFERDAAHLHLWPKTERLLKSMASSDRARAEESAVEDQQFGARPKL